MRSLAAPLVKLSIFAFVTVVLTALLATTIASVGFGDTVRYKAKFTDVTGLVKGDDVRIAGVKIGSIDKLRLVSTFDKATQRRASYAEVTFSVDKSQRLSTGTIARIRYRNLVGQRYLALSEGPGADIPLHKNQFVKKTYPALDLTVLFNGFKPLFQALSPKDVNSFSLTVIQTLQGEGGTVNSLLARTADLTDTLADRDAVIGRVITNLNRVLDTVNQRDAQLSDLIVQLQRFVSGLAQDRKVIGNSLQSISELSDATSGLIRDARAPLKVDVNRLYAVSKTLNDSQAIVEGVLKRLPGKLIAITRTASYGSWFNFYLCDFIAEGLPVTISGPNPDTGRCAA